MDSDTVLRAGTRAAPEATEQSRLFDLLGRINYVVLRGSGLYLQAGGKVYRVRYGAYWQSVYSGEQHWELRCEEVGYGVWADGHETTFVIDLPIRYTRHGWVIEVGSLFCLLYSDLLAVNGGAFEDAKLCRQ
ncbi:MAG TPA: hypothetical protein VF064_10500 [Pyrinomonadaceae bacterium]